MPKLVHLQRLVAAVRNNHGKRSPSRSRSTDDTRDTNLPYLPSEIWLLILRYATSSCPNQESHLRTVSFLSLSHSHSHLHHRLAHYRAVMRRKALMTLVCKHWYTLAQEVLYEFVWISRASEARELASILSRNGSNTGSGNYIRRLHIETPSLERCCPVDLRTILDCAPRLVVYSDYRSVRRNIYEEKSNPRSSPDQLLSALAHPNNSLRQLSWTNYDDISFHLHMSPMLETTAANLEFLELNFCSSHLHSMFFSSSPSVDPDTITLTLPALRSLKVTLDNATFTVLSTWSMPSLRNLSVLSADFSYASSGFSQFFKVHGPKLTQLELGHSSSIIEEHYLTTHPNSSTSASAHRIPLADWCPNLVEFICSADAEWNWQQPDWIAPHVLLPTHPTLQFIGIRDIDKRLRDDVQQQQQHMAAYDDAMERPFFVLLEQIGSLLRREAFPALLYIRDLSWESDLLRRGVGSALGFGIGAGSASASAVGLVHGIPTNENTTTTTQRVSGLGSLLSSVRRKRGWSDTAAAVLMQSRRQQQQQQQQQQEMQVDKETMRVLRFWQCVLEKCREGGVWLEDYRGVNVTMRDLRRVEAGKGAGNTIDFGRWTG